MNLTSTHGLSNRQLSVIRFALHRFMADAHDRANAAGQDKAGRYFKPGAVEAFLTDAKDAESLLAHLPARGVALRVMPLSEAQVMALVPSEQAGWSREHYCQWMARAVERAHGIDATGVTACPHGVPHRWACEKCDTASGAALPNGGQRNG